ncbi:MAG: hypothetical protein RL237_473 [Actinomycetota bacterium]
MYLFRVIKQIGCKDKLMRIVAITPDSEFPMKVNDSCYPFSLSYFIQCFLRIKAEAADENLLVGKADYLTQEKDPEFAIEKLLKFSKTVVIKLGKDGAIAKTRGEDLCRISALPSNVVDTTGAGDSFAAGFISSWQSNGDLNAALNAGTELAAKCVAHIGARPLVAPH